MTIMEFITKIAWPVVAILGLLVLIIYRGPVGDFISNLRKGKVVNKKGEGFSVDVEVERPSQGTQEVPPSFKLLEKQVSEKTKHDQSQEILQNKSSDVETDWAKLLFQQKYPEARQSLLEIIDKNTDISLDDLFWYKGEAAQILSRYDYQKGKEEFEELISKNPEAIALYLQYVDILIQRGDLDKASSVIEKYPGNMSNKHILLFQKAEILINKKNDTQAALQIIDELILQNENVFIKARAHILKGAILRKQEKIEEAKVWFYKAFKVLPTDEYILREVAEIFSEINDQKSVLFFRKQLADLNTSESTHWGYMGNALVALDLNNHAMEAYEKGNQLTSGQERWLIANIGNLYNNVGLYDKAIEFLQKAVEMDSKDQYSHERLASALAKKEKESTKVSEILEEIKLLIAKLD